MGWSPSPRYEGFECFMQGTVTCLAFDFKIWLYSIRNDEPTYRLCPAPSDSSFPARSFSTQYAWCWGFFFIPNHGGGVNISSVSCAMFGLMRSGYSSISRVILLGYMSLSFEDLIIKFICWYTCCVNRRPRKVRASLPISEPLTVGHKGVCWSFKLGCGLILRTID